MPFAGRAPWSLALVLVWFAAFARAQEAAAATAARTIELQNLTPHARSEVVAAVVPFARGECSGIPSLHVDGRATAWQPFGLPWPDGSVRQALCLFRADLAANATASVRLTAGAGPEPTDAFDELPAEILVRATTDLGTFEGPLPRREFLEDHALRKVELRGARLGSTGLVAELIVHHARGDAHAYVDAAVFFSDPGTQAMQCVVKELAFETKGMALLFRHPGRHAVKQQTTASGSRVVLLEDQVLGDGQGLRRCGALLPALGADARRDGSTKAAVLGPVRAGTSWSGTGAFGPFGEPAKLPPWLDRANSQQALAARHAAFAATEKPQPDPFANYEFSGTRNAGQTGDQMDFGLVKLSLQAATGWLGFVHEVEASVLQEACRPVHQFEADGRMVRAKDHPEWIVWSGRTHWHPEVSKDRLGKPVPEPPFETHGWTGKDRQHWSSNYLGAFAQLTGAHWARRELAHEVELFLSGETIDPNRSTSGTDAPRGAGRTHLAACWMALVTGDAALVQRMHERLDRVNHAQWAGRELPKDAVRTMQIHSPDARMLGGAVRYWAPWQDALAAAGFAAAHRVTGNEKARELAEALATTVVRHGFLVDDKECIVATALQWLDGKPLSPEQQRDPACALWSYGTGFNEWALGAVELARAVAVRDGDEAMRQRAEGIQRRVRAGQRRPGDGLLDRLSEWDALRWD